MDFKNKYFKYKEKYLKLKKQFGGYKRIIRNRDNMNQRIIINNKSTAVNMELIVNKIDDTKLENRKVLGDFLFDSRDDTQVKELNNNDFKIINIILKEIEGSITKDELDFLNELRGIKKITIVAETEVVNETPFFKYKYINPIPDSIKVKKIDTLFSLLFSFDNQSFSNSNGYVSYFINRPELIQERLKFLELSGIVKINKIRVLVNCLFLYKLNYFVK